MTLEIKTAETDKDKMFEAFRARSEAFRRQNWQQQQQEYQLQDVPHEPDLDKDALPSLKHTEEPHEDSGWIKFDKPVLYLLYVATLIYCFPG